MHQKPEIGGSTIKTTLNPACKKKKNDNGITVFAERKRERGKEFGSARFQQKWEEAVVDPKVLREKLKERGNSTELLVERERRWRRKETSQNISGEINKKCSKWEYVGSGYLMNFFCHFNGVAVSCAKGASQALGLHVSHLSFVFPPREAV